MKETSSSTEDISLGSRNAPSIPLCRIALWATQFVPARGRGLKRGLLEQTHRVPRLSGIQTPRRPGFVPDRATYDRNMADGPKAAHVMILGCGRSGTSIFGELFEHLGPYAYWSEPKYGRLWQLDWSEPQAVKVPAEDPEFASTPGLSFPLEHLLENLPEPRRFYWQVRHPLDAICSLRPGIANNWGHHPKPPDWREWLDRPLLERCAHHWNYLNTAGYRAVREIARPTRFEDFIQDPRGFAEGICRDVGLAPEDHADALDAWANRVQNTNNEKFVEAKTSRNYSRPDHRTRIDRWKENLTREAVDRLTPMVADAARVFGYELE